MKNSNKVSILNLRQGDEIKFADGLGTHTALVMSRPEKWGNRNEYSVAICYTSTTNEKYTEVGSEGYKFFRNYKSTVTKIS